MYSLLVPESENYIIRSSRKFQKGSQWQDDLKKCFSQEGNHSVAHSWFAKKFQDLGYKFDVFLSLYKKISYEVPEKYCSKKYNLVGAAACEQLNTALSVASLSLESMQEGAGETLDMLEWHFLEEIEHREVIFNLMQENKASSLIKLFVMSSFLVGFSVLIPLGALILGFQDGSAKRPKFWWEAITHPLRMSGHYLMASLRFCAPGYHPKNEWLPVQYEQLQVKFSS